MVGKQGRICCVLKNQWVRKKAIKKNNLLFFLLRYLFKIASIGFILEIFSNGKILERKVTANTNR